MKKIKWYIALLVISFFIQDAKAQQVPGLSTIGAMNKMGETNFAPQIWLDTLADKSHLYGLGPYGTMQGEITIVDGKPFYASAYEEGKAVVGLTWDMKSPFFVSTNVDKWNVFEITDSITSVDELQDVVSKLAKREGYDLQEPFAFRIAGVLNQATLHIVTPRSEEVEGYRENVKSQKFSFDDIPGEIIGFYSEHHQGVFTSSKSYIHVHFIKDDYTFMGHLDQINAGGNSLQLYLPAKL